MPAWSLVSPANRGIGLALTRHLLKTTKTPVIATTRHDVSENKRLMLEGLPDVDPERLHVLTLDVTDESTIIKAAERAKQLFPPGTAENHLRLSFINPGILHVEKSPAKLDASSLLSTFQINSIGPLLVLKHFSALLPAKKARLSPEQGLPPQAVWTTMAARVGSTTDNSLGGWYSYRASKAAVFSFTKTFDQFLKVSSGDRAFAVALHPGTVRTGFSREFWDRVQEGKLFTPEFSAERLCEVVRGLEVERGRGRCWDWEGKEVPP